MTVTDLYKQINRGLLALALLVLVGAAGAEPPNDRKRTVYEVTLLPSLGGTESRGNSINERGWVAGYSNLPGDANRHATLWRNGTIVDLGTLGNPGGNSSVPLDGMNNSGTIVGISQTAEPEPEGELWSCSIFFPEGTNTGLICRGFIWQEGEMRPVPTLGGNNGFATAVNERGQVTGWAETDFEDPTCIPPQVFQFQGFIWEPRKGRLTPLPPFGDGTSSTGNAINEKGEVAGISGICDNAVGRFSAEHAVLWDKGDVIELGDLGGITWHTPWDINNSGDVVGFSNPPGDDEGQFIAHAFFRAKEDGIVRDLGTLPGNAFSQAQGINDRGQVVGISHSGESAAHAFIWEQGKDDELVDLNTLAPGFDGVLIDARDINQQGQITGSATDPATGETRAFIATPVGRR